MSIVELAKTSGKIPPSLLQQVSDDSAFEAAVSAILDPNALALSSEAKIADFESLMQMAANTAPINGDRSSMLSYRRCIILAIVGSTPSTNAVLPKILQHTFLKSTRQWLDDLLNKSIGGTDLLLHMLTNITNLPVTRSAVKESGMGKAIGQLEKHKICAGTQNEVPIKQRTKLLKDAWNKSAKARKELNYNKTSDKKDDVTPSSPTVKKAKIEKSSFSSLLKKVNPKGTPKTVEATAPRVSKPDVESVGGSVESANKFPTSLAGPGNKKNNRVKWKDHFGGNITANLVGGTGDSKSEGDESALSMTDRRKRDRFREKELLANVKRSKLMDDDDDGMSMNAMISNVSAIKPTIAWHTPALLPSLEDVVPPQVNSQQLSAQTTRIASTVAARYFEGSVPSNPAPLSDVEQALDMASQTSAVLQPIPFFVPQAPVAPEPAPAPAAAQPSSYAHPPPPNALPPGSIDMASQALTKSATANFVQSLGLPMFLVGQNVDALQTLARNPTLLGTFVDGSGMYDQARIINLVQTLTQNIAPTQQGGNAGGYQQQHSSSSYGSEMQQQYGNASAYGQSQQGPSHYGSSWQQGGAANAKPGGYRGSQSSTEGNLHLSGYGPSTTQSDIIALFSQYVHVDEVVMKGTFCFVNTSDPNGAKTAREVLNGALLGGSPVRINMAQRKNRDNSGASSFRNNNSFYGNSGNSDMNGRIGGMGMQGQSNVPGVPLMPNQAPMGQGGNETVRDDRGNPATKNLFVAGYGAGTTEMQLREAFAQHATIVGIIMKGSFSFVNTSDRNAAIQGRQAMSGTMLNGGVLRINFAKETGRLGTSFDLTYSGGAGPSSGGGGGSHSHYGRSY